MGAVQKKVSILPPVKMYMACYPMKKEKIHMEYPLSATSKAIIWGAISAPSGLENWFADKVKANDKVFSFTWGKTEHRDAEVVNYRAYSFIRFHWMDDEDPKTYFEIKMCQNELTEDYSLEVTDFALPEEVEDQKGLWDSQIETLRRTCGM